tara:strand:+ start:1535 stop:2065 length:531 start_codon:yes stop_codon:yes gene_type:complete
MNIIKEKIKSDNIENLISIKLDTFQDYRGEIWTVFSEEYCDYKFVADKISISNFGVLRGLHGDSHTAKFITCLSGQMQLAVVDLRRGSKTYGGIDTFLISDFDPTVVIVPAGCINAHLSLTEKCIFYYKWSESYQGPDKQVTVAWDDPDLNINWIIKSPILSGRDKNGVSCKGIYL